MSDDRGMQDAVADGDAPEPSRGRPLLATSICAILLLLSMSGRDGASLMESGGGGTLLHSYVIGGALVGALLWGLAFAITIRKSSTGWKAGSAIGLVILGGLVALADIGATEPAAREDTRDIARQMKQMLEAGEVPPERVEGGTGPMSRMFAAAVNGMLADRRAFERELQASGLQQVVSFDGLTRSSPVLRNCDNVAGIADRARFYGHNYHAHLATAQAIGDEAVRAGQLPAVAVSDFLSGARNAGARYERQWTLTADIAIEAGAICRILASRPWTKPGEMVLFNDQGDADELNRHLERVEGYIADQESARVAARANAREQIGKMERGTRESDPACRDRGGPDRPRQRGPPPPARCASRDGR